MMPQAELTSTCHSFSTQLETGLSDIAKPTVFRQLVGINLSTFLCTQLSEHQVDYFVTLLLARLHGSSS